MSHRAAKRRFTMENKKKDPIITHEIYEDREEYTVDVRGNLCPIPVIEAKKVSDAHPDAYIRVIVDNEVSRDNVVKLGEFRGYDTHVLEQEENFIVVFVPREELTAEEKEKLSVLDSSDLENIDLDDIFETVTGTVREAVTNPTIAGGEAPFYMAVGCGSLERSIAAYEATKNIVEAQRERQRAVQKEYKDGAIHITQGTPKSAIGGAIAEVRNLDGLVEGENMQNKGVQEKSYGGKVLLITKDYLGEGNEELGRNLMKTFFFCLTEADSKPKGIYFINSAVTMVGPESVHLENLQKLRDMGVDVASCGICLESYQLKEKVQVGTITNMYAIVESMMSEAMVTL